MDSITTTAKTYISNIRRHIENDKCNHCITILKGAGKQPAPEPENPNQATSRSSNNV